MADTKVKFPKKGAFRRMAEAFTKLRKTPLSKKVYDVVEKHYEKSKLEKKPEKVAQFIK